MMCLVVILFIFIYLFLKFYLFIFCCIGSSFLHTGFLQLWRVRATLHCGAWASRCGGFSCCRVRALGMRASVVVACGLSSYGLRALEHRLGSCCTRAQLLCDMWDLARPGLEPMSPALAGRFPTTVPPGKPYLYLFIFILLGFHSQSLICELMSFVNFIRFLAIISPKIVSCPLL